VGLSFENAIGLTYLLPLLQLSLNHLNKHFLCLNFGNLKVKAKIWMNNDASLIQMVKNRHKMRHRINTWTFPCGSLSSINCSWIAGGKNSKSCRDWFVSFFFHSPSSSTTSCAKISFSSAIRYWTWKETPNKHCHFNR